MTRESRDSLLQVKLGTHEQVEQDKMFWLPQYRHAITGLDVFLKVHRPKSISQSKQSNLAVDPEKFLFLFLFCSCYECW